MVYKPDDQIKPGINMKKTILLLTHSADFYTVDRVQQAIAERGLHPFRFKTDKFPTTVKLSIHQQGSHISLDLRDDETGTGVSGEEIYSVWYRKVWTPFIDPDMDPLLRSGCLNESGSTLDSFLAELDNRGLRWIDSLKMIRRGDDKLFQLREAGSAHIDTPKTLISNNPDQVRHFYRELEGNVVAKMMTPLRISMRGGDPFVYTSRLKPEDLDDLDSLRYSPMIFQEYVKPVLELRTIYVDGQLFTGAINPKDAQYEVDWRSSTPGTVKWQDHTIPDCAAEKIRHFMKRVNLYFGAFDFILDTNGNYIFLEINPTGEWGMLERDLELPISKAIADALTK